MLNARKQQLMNQKKQKYTYIASSLVFGLPMLLILLMFGCQTETLSPRQDSPTIHQEHYKLLAEWNDIYDNVDTTIDESVDMEVWGLREKLKPYGITVFRIDPNNAEHQRRYKRHLSGNLNPRMEMTDWQIHKVHSFPANGTMYDDDCPYCKKQVLNIISL